MILTSIVGTIGAILIGVPLGLFTAVFICYLAPKKLEKVLVSAVELLAGIPSVIFGLVGMIVLSPFIANTFDIPSGATLLTSMLVLAVMILPTIVSVTTTSLRAVPQEYYDGSLALGATPVTSIFKMNTVSYTHLDVYKRQALPPGRSWRRSAAPACRKERCCTLLRCRKHPDCRNL